MLPILLPLFLFTGINESIDPGLPSTLTATDLETDVGYPYLTMTHASPHIRKTLPYKRHTGTLEKAVSGVIGWELYPD